MTLASSNELPRKMPHAPVDDPAVRLFKLILPTQGHYIAAIKRKNSKGFQHIFCETPEQLWEIIEEADRDGFECYFACASFKQPLHNQPGTPQAERLFGRTVKNVYAVKAFWLDIDVGKDKPYKTRDEALAALAPFCKKLNLPRPIVVGSGGDKSGLHVYWPLAQDITHHATWQGYANGLKILCDEYGLHADRVRTADLSSVLRPPGTHNRKHGPDILVEVGAEDLEIEPYALDQFKIFYETIRDSGKEKSGKRQRQTKRQTNGNGQEHATPRRLTDARIYSGEPPPSYVSEILKHCPQMQRLHDEKGKTEEPHWRACLGVCAYCKDGDDFAHKLSEGDTARYTWEETEERLERWRNSADGATTCKHFHDEVDPTICEKCEHWKKINSPYALGIIPSTDADDADDDKDNTIWEYWKRLPISVQRTLRWERTAKGALKPNSYRNAATALTVLGLKCSHDVFHDRKIVEGDITENLGPQLSDAICRALREKMIAVFGPDFGLTNIQQAAERACEATRFDPVVDYITKLRWDGVLRLDDWAIKYLGCEDTPLNRSIGRKMLIALIRRAQKPGCKFDYVVILEGPQGSGKSTALRIIAGDDNFSDAPILHLETRAQQETVKGKWIIELSELAGLRKTEIETTKSFISRQSDDARPAYGHFPIDQTRRCIFVGTTNDDRYLRDMTGNRRFLPLKTGTIDLLRLQHDRDQLLAEAAYHEAKDESLIIPPELWGEAAIAQEERLMIDAWEDKLVEVQGEIVKGEGDSWEERISTTGVLRWLDLSPIHQTDFNAKRAAIAMRRTGWRGPKAMKFKVRTIETTEQPSECKIVTRRGFWRPASEPPAPQSPPPKRTLTRV
jgi:hypothetical protein